MRELAPLWVIGKDGPVLPPSGMNCFFSLYPLWLIFIEGASVGNGSVNGAELVFLAVPISHREPTVSKTVQCRIWLHVTSLIVRMGMDREGGSPFAQGKA